jgi:ABC-2 type transport system ATP-binding protein
MAYAVEVRDLRKAYGARPAVAGVDFTVDAGEIVALLGPNGAGKTTTVELCAGFRRPDSGHVRVLGVEPFRAPAAWKARIGVVTQQTTDLKEFTVGQAIWAMSGCYGQPRPIDEVIEAVGLSEQRNQQCALLSGGQRRRLDVALGILGSPELLFLDEPTTGFDPEARRLFWTLIEQLRSDGTTILLTTHYLDEAEHLADRVGVIAAGRMMEINTPELIGGRADALSVVGWIDENGMPHSERTATPTALIRQLSAGLDADREIAGLSVVQPTLEDIYVQMISTAGPE